MKIGFLATGWKGLWTLQRLASEGIASTLDIDFVMSYGPQKELIREWCGPLVKFENSNLWQLSEAEKIFVIGWQYLLKPDDRLVVLHDSYLPLSKGFCPTATALIAGNRELGVTAFQPTEERDVGPIYYRDKFFIDYPIKISEALAKVCRHYAKIIARIIKHDPKPVEIKSESSTYSIWRDEQDYWIDWNQSADTIKRLIDASGFPYEGAKSMYGKHLLTIQDATVLPDKEFVVRQPGKVWKVKDGNPEVICGRGMLEITKSTDTTGKDMKFYKLRKRFYASNYH